MKALNYICIICLLTISISGFAQAEAEETIVREGDLVFIKSKDSGGNITLRRAGTENLVPESYSEIYLEPERIEDLYKEIFPPERVEELSQGRLFMYVYCNGVKREIAYIEFMWRWIGGKNKDDFPLTLKELDLLETRIKAYPFKFYVTKGGKIDRFSLYTFPLWFDRLYTKPPPRKSDQPAEITESIVKNGDVAYIKKEKKTWMGTDVTIRRAETATLIPESYADAHLMTPDDDPHIWNQNLELIADTLFKAVFSKERAEEFGTKIMGCRIKFNAIKEEIAYVEFSYPADYPPTFEELILLEEKLKAYPFAYCKENKKKSDHFSTAYFPIRFERLYTDYIGFGRGNKEKSIVREGDLEYIKSKNPRKYPVLRKAGTENLIAESYGDSYLVNPNPNQWESIYQNLFKEVFSKERAQELTDEELTCHIRYNSIKEEIAYIEFRWSNEGDCPLTLKELDLLESKLKSYPFRYRVNNKTKMKHFSTDSYTINFNHLYHDDQSIWDKAAQVQQGNVTYLESKTSSGRSIFKREGMENMVPESYVNAYLTSPGEDQIIMDKTLFHTIFSKERAEQLYDGDLKCSIKFNASKKEIAYIEFSWNVFIDFPLTLEELDQIEATLKAYPFEYHIIDSRKMERFSTSDYYLHLSKIYEN